MKIKCVVNNLFKLSDEEDRGNLSKYIRMSSGAVDLIIDR